MAEYVLVEKKEAFAVVSLNRPEVLNCFNNELLEQLYVHLSQLETDDTTRVIILTGSGRGFCAGGDLDTLATAGSEEAVCENIELANKAIRKLYYLKKPVIAMVNGVAAGAGFNLALACDMIFADEKASFIQSFMHIAISPDCGGHWLLTGAVGPKLARELIYTARPVGAKEGKEMGFVNHIYSGEMLREETMAFAAALASSAPRAISASKELLCRVSSITLDESLEIEAKMQVPLLLSSDCKEKISAFKKKK